MARPFKIGLDYFPVDVKFDRKIEIIEHLYGNDGIVWIIKFWQEAYQTDNGEISLDGLFGELFAKNCRITIEQHEKIIISLINIDLIRKTSDGFYTSSGIKKRMSIVSSERKKAIQRKNKRIKESKVKESKASPDCSPNNLTPLKGLKINKIKEDNPAYRISFILYKKISESKTTMKRPDLSTWAVHIKNLHEIDKKPWDLINKIMRNALNDDFWGKILRSTKKLRDHILSGKFDKFIPDEYRTDEEYETELKKIICEESKTNLTQEKSNG
jgi:hypothetical protein